MANRAWMNFGHMYANLTSPAMVSCQLTVDSTAGEGLSSLESNGYVKQAFMASGSPSPDNPNPQAGVIWLQLSDNYAKMINLISSIVQPLSGSNVPVHASGSPLTVGNAYTITVLGTTTEAQWHSLGVPAGVKPAVGVNFIALLVGLGTGTGQVQVSDPSGISSIEIVPDPQQSLGPQGASNQGAWIMLKCMAPTSSSVTTPVATAPADGSRINLTLLMDNSSVTVDGL